MLTVLIELAGGEGVVRRDDGEIVLPMMSAMGVVPCSAGATFALS